MSIPQNKTSSIIINNQISIVYKVILPIILLYTIIWFVLGFRIRNSNESWINYKNKIFGEIRTGKDSPLVFYQRPQYRLPYRYPLGIKTSYPETHIAPFML